MKAITALEWICRESINGEYINIIDVPKEGANEWEQNEAWWISMFGGMPATPVPSGRYLYYYDSSVEEMLNEYGEYDAQIEIPCSMGGFDYIYLYKLED